MPEDYAPKHSTGEYVVSEEVSNFLEAVNENWRPLVGRHRRLWKGYTNFWQQLEWNKYKERNDNFHV